MAATGKVAGVDPRAWKIIDGKLYLSRNQEGAEKFARVAGTAIPQADENWVKLSHQK